MKNINFHLIIKLNRQVFGHWVKELSDKPFRHSAMIPKCLLFLGTKTKILENKMSQYINVKIIEIINNYVNWNWGNMQDSL